MLLICEPRMLKSGALMISYAITPLLHVTFFHLFLLFTPLRCYAITLCHDKMPSLMLFMPCRAHFQPILRCCHADAAATPMPLSHAAGYAGFFALSCLRLLFSYC